MEWKRAKTSIYPEISPKCGSFFSNQCFSSGYVSCASPPLLSDDHRLPDDPSCETGRARTGGGCSASGGRDWAVLVCHQWYKLMLLPSGVRLRTTRAAPSLVSGLRRRGEDKRRDEADGQTHRSPAALGFGCVRTTSEAHLGRRFVGGGGRLLLRAWHAFSSSYSYRAGRVRLDCSQPA